MSGTDLRRRILVVEDDALSRELLGDWLEGEGYSAEMVADLAAGRAAFDLHTPDAVLLDVCLGQEDGLELAAWVRRDPRFVHIPVIAVTAHALLTERQRILQAGCNACLSKPVEFAALRGQLQRWLGGA